jgi:hypothetical protein
LSELIYIIDTHLFHVQVVLIRRVCGVMYGKDSSLTYQCCIHRAPQWRERACTAGNIRFKCCYRAWPEGTLRSGSCNNGGWAHETKRTIFCWPNASQGAPSLPNGPLVSIGSEPWANRVDGGQLADLPHGSIGCRASHGSSPKLLATAHFWSTN